MGDDQFNSEELKIIQSVDQILNDRRRSDKGAIFLNKILNLFIDFSCFRRSLFENNRERYCLEFLPEEPMIEDFEIQRKASKKVSIAENLNCDYSDESNEHSETGIQINSFKKVK